jgi:hypothetical protein
MTVAYGSVTSVFGADLKIGMWLDSLDHGGARMICGLRIVGDEDSLLYQVAFGPLGVGPWDESKWVETIRADVEYDVVDPDTESDNEESPADFYHAGEEGPTLTHCPYPIYEGSFDRVGEAWSVQWNRQLIFGQDLDRDAWAGETELWAVARTWYYSFRYTDGYAVSVCTAYQVCRDPADPDSTGLDCWLDYAEDAADGYHRSEEIRDMAGDDEPPTVESWNQMAHDHEADWAILADN